MTLNRLALDRNLIVHSTGAVEPISRAAVLHWLDAARAAVKGTPWAEQLMIDRIDALEVLLEPLHLELLGALRGAADPHAAGERSSLAMRARWLGYRLKKMYQEGRARLAANRTGRVTTLFWPRELTHINAQLPVLASLQRRGGSCAVLACHPRTFDQLRSRGIDAVSTCAAWPDVVRRARRTGRERSRVAAGGPAVKLPAFATRNRSIALEPIWRATVCRLLPDVFEAVANARAAIQRFEPEVLVIGNDITLQGRAACLVAQSQGVPTAVLMHGNVTGDELNGRHVAGEIIVYGEASRRELIRLGGDAARILACGAPYLDQRPRQTGSVDPRLAARLGLRPQDRWILAATSGPGDRISHQHHQLVVQNLLRLATTMPEVHLVIKLHRKDRAEHYKGLQSVPGGRFHVLPFCEPGLPASIFDWLQGCPLVLTGASSVAVEAMLLDVPVITMDFCGEINDVDFIDAGTSMHVTNYQALAAAVDRVLASPTSWSDVRDRVQQYLEDAFLLLDGRSADRAADAIQSLAGQSTITG